MFSFKPSFSLPSFTFIKRFFRYFSLSAIGVVSFGYLRFLIFLPQLWYQLVIHPVHHFTWYTLRKSYKARWQYTDLLYSFPNFQLVCCFMSGSNCCFLIHIQVSQETGKGVSYSHILKNFPVCCDHRIKVSSVVNEAEVDVFLEFPCFFYDPADIGNLISHSSAFSKSSLYI